MQRRTGPRRLVYEEWMDTEGIPIHKATTGVADITELPRGPWARMGGLGTFIELEGHKLTGSGLYVAEIPAGGALEPERHIYEEPIYVLQGRGLAEVWQDGQEKNKTTFEWGEGSTFAVPLNTWHRLVNGGPEPVLFLGYTNAPVVMEAFRNTEFIFNCPYNFTDRFTGKADYFVASEKRVKDGISPLWETNFVPDVRSAFLDNLPEKAGPDGLLTFIEMAAFSGLHLSEWLVGRYHKGHYHGPGPVLLGLKSEGYALVWPAECGIHPYQDGHGDKVVKMNWKKNSIYTPFCDSGYYEFFHQHFNTGKEPARHMALKSAEHGFGRPVLQDAFGKSVRDGGWLIEYEDEDPEVRRVFKEELRKNGVEFTMPPVVYRTDPFDFSP